MGTPAPSEVLAKLQDQQSSKSQLSILRISEPIAFTPDTANRNQSPSKRRSDVSTDAFDNPTPASLEADLIHYKVSLVATIPDPPINLFLNPSNLPARCTISTAIALICATRGHFI
jgi:hypothetical protein